MPRFPFSQIDAFASEPLSGNPCAVIFDADPLTDEQMQAIALEMNLSETAFVLRSDHADVRARYFTPAEEIPLAGHPTIATIYALFHTGRRKLEGDRQTVSLELQVGPIRVEVVGTNGRVDEVVMSQKRPEFFDPQLPSQVLPIFGLEPEDALPGVPIEIVSTGTPQLMVALRDRETLARARIADESAYRSLRGRTGFFSAHLFCLEGFTDQGRTSARHFGVPPDLREDPFTGSATGGMGAFLWRHKLIDSRSFVAEQGHDLRRPGTAKVEVVGPPDSIETVRVSGGAVEVVRGELIL